MNSLSMDKRNPIKRPTATQAIDATSSAVSDINLINQALNGSTQ
jgi:hypothetical protein